jgi:uncharacterized protein YggL (DUF469 family)
MKYSKLKKRLRKKYHVGEFTLMGFTIVIMVPDIDENDPLFMENTDKMYDDIIGIVEGEKLGLGGGGGRNYLEFYVCDKGVRNTVTEEKIMRVLDKVKALDYVKDAVVVSVMDAYNFTEKEWDDNNTLIDEVLKKLGAKSMTGLPA